MIAINQYTSPLYVEVLNSLINKNIGQFNDLIQNTPSLATATNLSITYKFQNSEFTLMNYSLLNVACLLREEECVDILLRRNPEIINHLFFNRIPRIELQEINKNHKISVLELLAASKDEISDRIFYKIIGMNNNLHQRTIKSLRLEKTDHIIHSLVLHENLLQMETFFSHVRESKTKKFIENSEFIPQLYSDIKTIIAQYNSDFPCEEASQLANFRLTSCCDCSLDLNCSHNYVETPLSLLVSLVKKRLIPSETHIKIARLLLKNGARVNTCRYFAGFRRPNPTLLETLHQSKQTWLLEILKNEFGIPKDDKSTIEAQPLKNVTDSLKVGKTPKVKISQR